MPLLSKYQEEVGSSDSESETDSVIDSNVSEEGEYAVDNEEKDITTALDPNAGDEEIEEGVVDDEDEDEDEDADVEDEEGEDEEGAGDEDENYDSEDEEGEKGNVSRPSSKNRKSTSIPPVQNEYYEGNTIDNNDDDDDEDEDDDAYLQKFNEDINKNFIADNHPECINVNFDEVLALTKVVRDPNNNIVDDLHRTLPYLTKYEKTRILGQRAKQINAGMTTFVKVPENVIDGYLIAEMELAQKKIPFIIKRPIPGGGCEYWCVSDLELVAF